MPENIDLLPAVLNSWDRNNTILTNLLRMIPEGKMELRAMDSSPSIEQMFFHMHYVRLVFVSEDAPEFARAVPATEWDLEPDRDRMRQMLNDSARAVREAVQNRLQAGRQLDMHYDHPLLLLQHMIFHEGYHHGQIKLALKLAGHELDDKIAGPASWGVFIDRT